MIQLCKYMSILLLSILCISCGKTTYDTHYISTHVGTLSGKILVEWVDMDTFIFTPDTISPLIFTRYNGEVIQPGMMYTDGGTIPRPLWALRNYGPWGYAPAFIIHDWLYQQYQCRKQVKYIEGVKIYSVEEAADVMSEIIKTMMETGTVDTVNKQALYFMDMAVRSKLAYESYENGTCDVLPRDIKKPIFLYEIDYTAKVIY